MQGANWLASQQEDDGCWRSKTYGQMQSGVGNTALVLDALTRMKAEWRESHQAAIGRGFAFLLANLDDDGYISAPRHSADYPTYATALLLSAVERVHPERWQAERRQMRHYLLQVQRRESKDANYYGGWSQVGGEPEDSGAKVNVNISVSRFVAEALAHKGGVPTDTSDAAQRFLERCRNPDDGGYFFVPAADDPLNKAGVGPTGAAASYGTATADAVLALLAWGVSPDDPQLCAAVHWLQSQRSLDIVPGFSSSRPRVVGAEQALVFYYWAAVARVMARFPDSPLAARRAELRGIVVRHQQPDGTWRNANGLMREDDPLIATSLAVTALTALDDVSRP
ncbi:MAG: hypothetical protein AB7G28_20415 [Pirellulales bacterium]